ncbi:MAG TPA: endonuclease/exonuclease/phosphatase family protein, partial [Kofleriaceae bacterium]|nr:endonuclease/exonuclease/phosphatase family protein [Kofleriaceae bacterium]
PQSVVVLAGDLNDVPGSPPLDALVANGGLVRLADDLPVAAQATYSFGGRGQAIDHLLVRVVAASVRACRSPRASGATAAAGDGVAAITRRSARSSCSDGECTPHAAECKSLGARVIVTRLRAAG